MFSFDEKKAWIDELIIKCWSDGFSAINRKHGKYLPEPPKIGDYDIDFLAKMNKDFAIGIVISDEDVSENRTLDKIRFLASRTSKLTGKPVKLFIGVSKKNYHAIKRLVFNTFSMKASNIKIYILDEEENSASLFDFNDKVDLNIKNRYIN